MPAARQAERIVRVAHVIDELAPAGGIEEALLTLIQALFAHDVQSVVLTFQAPGAANPYARRLQAIGASVHSPPAWLARSRLRVAAIARSAAVLLLMLLFPLTLTCLAALGVRRGNGLRRSWESLVGRLQPQLRVEVLLRQVWQRYLRAWLQRQAVDCVHVHGYGCGAVPQWGLDAAVASGLPVIYTEHGLPWPELRQRPDLRAAIADCRQRIAVSRASADAMRAHCAASDPLHVVHHVVPDLARLGPPPSRAAVTAPIFGCVAMLRPGKGHVYWLRSMPTVLRRWPDARFVLAGDGVERASLEAEAARLGIVSQVDFLGCVDHAGLGQLLSQWDVFVLPSLNEPLGIVVVEAMAAGLPIVATCAGGVVDLVCDEQTALLVPPRDSERLAAAQLRLAGDPDLRARLGRAARRAYEQGPFTAGQVGSTVARIYWAALGGGAGQQSSAADMQR